MKPWSQITFVQCAIRFLAFTFVCSPFHSFGLSDSESAPSKSLRLAYGALHTRQLKPDAQPRTRDPLFAPLFPLTPQYPAGHFPQFVATGDFNLDGKLDLVVVDYCSARNCDPFSPEPSGVSILLGNGDGTFGPPLKYAVGISAHAVAVGDFNRDGKQDLAVVNACSDLQCTNYQSSISVLLGNGDGTFQNRVDYPTGSLALAIAVADLNGDNNEDLVTADTGQNSLSVLLGNGDGTFRSKVDYTTDSGPIAVVIADFNNDHKMDLVSANYFGNNNSPGDLSMLLGNGDGTFRSRQDFLTVLGNPSTVVAGDLNGDGILDIVTNTISCNVADSIVVIYGNGDGTFNPAGHVYFTGVNCGQTQVLATDFNGDNKRDIASLNVEGNAVSVFPGIGDGTFPYHVAWGTGALPVGIAVGDFNADGKGDLVAANELDDSISILLGNGDNTFQSRIDSDTFVQPNWIGSADFNRDGKGDLLTANFNYPTMSLLLGKGDGTFQSHVDIDTSGPFVITDFNLDGKPDFAVLDASVSIYLGKGDGTFEPPVHYSMPPSAVSLATADFNGDGKPDVIASFRGDPSGEGLRIYLGNGDGTLGAPTDYALASPGNLSASDFNNDGKADLLVCRDSDLILLIGNGNGTFQSPIAESNAAGVCPSFIADLNHDSSADLLAQSSNGIVVLLGNGDGSFQNPVETNLGGPATPNSVGDFDGDGKIDVAVNQNSTIVVLLGNDDGSLQLQGAYPVSGGGGMATVADFNADGKLDVASTNPSADTVSVLLNIAEIPMFTLSVNFAGAGSGTVTINPGGVVCTTSCSKSYANGTEVSLSATAKQGSTFAGWTGGGCLGTGDCKIKLTADQSVTATFDLLPDFTITASALTPGTVNSGQSATSTINVGAIAGFSSSVMLACSVSPAPKFAPQCSISPSSVTPGTPATLTVGTTAPTMSEATPVGSSARALFFGFLPIAGLTLAGINLRSPTAKSRILGVLCALLLIASLALQTACGGGSSSTRGGSSGTPPDTYTITITGTSGLLIHSTKIQLKVQ